MSAFAAWVPIAFEKILGQSVTVEMELAQGGTRYLNGIVSSFSEGKKDHDFRHFRATVVPHFWLWTRQFQSRIFQHLSVPEILKQVLYEYSRDLWLLGKDPATVQAETGTGLTDAENDEYQTYYYDYIYNRGVYPG